MTSDQEKLTVRGAQRKKEKKINKTKYLAIHANKCGPQDSLGIDYHWCGHGRGGTPNIELKFDATTGKLFDAVFIPEGARWGSGEVLNRTTDYEKLYTAHVALQSRCERLEKALEFAEYMAKAAEDHLDALYHTAECEECADHDDEDAQQELDESYERVGDMLSSLTSAIYEFRKRRDKV